MNTQRKRTILALDDDEVNLMILIKGVQESGYTVRPFTSGESAWQYLQDYPDKVDIALLDKMMPGLSGLELLKRMKATPALRHIPVIIQTGDVGVSQMREGLECGAHYYLTKPFHPEIMRAILHSAEGECKIREELLGQMSAAHAKFITFMQEGEFVIKTHADARVLAATLSQAATHPEFVALGLMELLSNAIEHGNLDIGYDRKRKCLISGNWEDELATRGAIPDYQNRYVHIRMEKTAIGLHLVIRDEGKGFDWRHHVYDEDGSLKLNEPSGRGIAKAMVMLDDVRYVGSGNEVQCNIGLPSYLTLMHGIGTGGGLRAAC